MPNNPIRIGDVNAPISAKIMPKIPHIFELSFINEKTPKISANGDNIKLINRIPINPITKLTIPSVAVSGLSITIFVALGE